MREAMTGLKPGESLLVFSSSAMEIILIFTGDPLTSVVSVPLFRSKPTVKGI
jgi:hypothetical protein